MLVPQMRLIPLREIDMGFLDALGEYVLSPVARAVVTVIDTVSEHPVEAALLIRHERT